MLKAEISLMNTSEIERNLSAPFSIQSDLEYLSDLNKRYTLLLQLGKLENINEIIIQEARCYAARVLESIRIFCNGNMTKYYQEVDKLVEEVSKFDLASSTINKTRAFPGNPSSEVQLFRGRIGSPLDISTIEDMAPLPKAMRAKSGNYRFSIPGNPSYYLANSSYGCWLEIGMPIDSDFNVSPVRLDTCTRVFNLAVSIFDRNFSGSDDEVISYLKLFMLTIACSYTIREHNRLFKIEYIVPQAIMASCRGLGFDAVAYYSSKVTEVRFARCAVNLALFIDYNDFSKLRSRMEIDMPYNYFIFKQLLPGASSKEYVLNSVKNSYIVNIGSMQRQHNYQETEFYAFDKFIYSSWMESMRVRTR